MPDINSLPPSPRPPPGLSSIPRTPSRQASYNASTPSAPHSPAISAQLLPASNPAEIVPPGTVENLAASDDNRGVGTGPGPVRHPRPLTAADLHLQLEKEQEAVVNRLTRELSALRQQSASVVSATSSASASQSEAVEASSGPLPHRGHHRTPSNASARSTTIENTWSSMDVNVGGVAGTVDRHPSRQNSFHSARVEHHSPNLHDSYARVDEVQHQRAEMDAVKRENDSLRRRVRELERTLRGRRESRTRSDSVSTAASATVGREREDEGIRVGESAGSAGIDRTR